MATDFPTSSDKPEGSHLPEWVQHLIADRQEHTLGGCAIGIVRDAVSKDGSLHSRAQSNDEIAQVAADTVSFLPEMKWTTGGAIRAALLLNPHGSLTDNLGGAGLNFLEGAALNKVGKLGASEGMFGKMVAGKLGDGLLAETFTHATIGLGMGAVRTGFSAESWKDNSGKFSLSAGGENVVKNGLLGAAVNVPAGMVGLRFGKAATVTLSESSPELASLVTNAGAGYTSGVVFGGLDAAINHRSWKEVLASMNQGGIVGGITGGLTHFASRESLTPGREQSSRLLAGASEGRPADRGLVRHRDALAELEKAPTVEQIPNPFDKVHIAQPEFQTLTRLGQRLLPQETQELNFVRIKANAKLEGPFKSLEDYSKKLTDSPIAVRIYEIDGHSTRIAVPEEYGKKLDEVRQLRLAAERDENLTERGSDAHKQIMEARAQLKSHPLGKRALPEDFIPFLDALPDRSYIKQLTLSEHADPFDAWNRQQYVADVDKLAAERGQGNVSKGLYEQAKTFAAAATANPTERTVTFFRQNRDFFMSDFIFHEWSHIADALLPEDNKLFLAAAKLERKGYYSREYAMKDDGENLAVHLGEKLLNYDGDGFTDVAVQAPLRAAVMGKMLKTVLDSAAPWARSVNHEALLNRVNAINEFVMPLARQELIDQLASPARETRKAAMQLFDGLGFKPEMSDFDLMRGIAGTSIKDPETAKAALSHAVDLTEKDPQERFRLYFDLGQPGSAVRDQAIDGLWRMKDYRAPGYTHYLKALGEAPNATEMARIAERMPDADGRQRAYTSAVRMARTTNNMTAALEIMRSAPDLNVKHFAFTEALAMAGKNQDKAVGVALQALTYESKLRPQALDYLTTVADPRTQTSIQRYLDDPNPEVAKRAAKANQRIEDALERAVEQSRFIRLQQQLNNGSVDQGVKAVDQLSQMVDIRSVRLLVEAAVTGGPTVSAHATEALKKFGSSTVKFEAREIGRKNPSLWPKVQKLLGQVPALAAHAG